LVEKLISHKDIENNSICIEVLGQKREKAATFSLLSQTEWSLLTMFAS
jgi:hypothetical protein